MANQELLQKLKYFIDKELENIEINGKIIDTNVGICFTVSKVASRILNKLGYKCNVKRVSILIGNKKGREIFHQQMQDNKFDKDEIIKDNGWIIGMGYTDADIDTFHYVVYFPDEKEIMDLTFGQADRPQRDLKCDAYWRNIDDLPETIIMIKFVDEKEKPGTFNPIYYTYKGKFGHVIKKGARELMEWKKSPVL